MTSPVKATRGTKLLPAITKTCQALLSLGAREHELRDHCWSCAPYWETYPVCPVHATMLKETEPINPEGPYQCIKAWCKLCRKHYALGG